MRSVTKVVPALMLLLFAACGGERGDVDTSGVALEMRIERLDRDLFAAPPDTTGALVDALVARYGGFFGVYAQDILQAPPLGDPALPAVLARFTHDPDWRDTQQAVDSVLGELEPQRRLFEGAFKRLKALFPDSLVPRVVAFNSGFNYGVYPTDSVLGVGLEWFIGPDQPVVQRLAPQVFPQFVKQRMVPDMLVPGAVKGWLLVHYTRDIRGADLLTNLVETGKVLALAKAMLPDVEARFLFSFTAEQLAWCEANEMLMWREIVGKEMLFSKDQEPIGRIMNDAPFTNGFPRESPGHVGEWIGYRMVRSYLDEHPDATFAELFAIVDPNTILKSYKPR